MSGLIVERKNEFDLEVVLRGLRNCRQLNGSILLDEYLAAFKELCRFFKLMGRLFGFVAADLESKIVTLEAFRTSPSKDKYETVQAMVAYEVDNGTANSGKRNPSGCRTLLRLQRALEFILQFMSEIAQSDNDARVSSMASKVYHETLAKHHPWLVRKMAGVVMYILPSKRDLIQMMCKQDLDSVLVLLEEVCETGTPVYQTIYKLYEDNDILSLP